MTSIQGIYAITDPGLIADNQLYDAVSQAIDGGLGVLQYRNKTASESLQLRQAEQLKKLCELNQILYLINDNCQLAKAVDADGVHIGKDDGAITEARQILGEQAVIGVSCYNQIENARTAEQDGANYVAFGRFFGSQTKPDTVQAYPEMINEAKSQLTLPIVAIGGITADNAGILVEAGVDALAVIHGIFGQADIKQACLALKAHFNK